MKNKNMKLVLYHGTSTKYLDKILKEGIKPRGNKNGNWKHSVKSKKDLVYLTDTYAPYFANAATKKPYKPVIIKLEINTKDFELYPDEDFICQSIIKTNNNKGLSLNELTEIIDPKMYPEQWKKSLKYFGNISTNYIPKECIKSYCIGDFMEFLRIQDPVITILNHIIMSKAYKASIKNLNFINI